MDGMILSLSFWSKLLVRVWKLVLVLNGGGLIWAVRDELLVVGRKGERVG